jgi:hypothetical protein
MIGTTARKTFGVRQVHRGKERNFASAAIFSVYEHSKNPVKRLERTRFDIAASAFYDEDAGHGYYLIKARAPGRTREVRA